MGASFRYQTSFIPRWVMTLDPAPDTLGLHDYERFTT
jgi:hypothetical protein